MDLMRLGLTIADSITLSMYFFRVVRVFRGSTVRKIRVCTGERRALARVGSDREGAA